MLSLESSIRRLLDNSRIRQLVDCQLADWSTRGLDNSRTGQLADAISDFACLVFLFGGICETTSCPVRDLSSLQVGNPRVGVSASCPVTQLTAGACCILRPVRPIWPMHGSYNGRCGWCVVHTDRLRLPPNAGLPRNQSLTVDSMGGCLETDANKITAATNN